MKMLYVDGLQHKGTMSMKPVFEKITNIQRSYVPLCGHTTIYLLVNKADQYCAFDTGAS